MSSKTSGIDVEVHSGETGCGNPCHPAHACAACEPFWQQMTSTGRFDRSVPPTFAGDSTLPKRNLGTGKLNFGHPSFRSNHGAS